MNVIVFGAANGIGKALSECIYKQFNKSLFAVDISEEFKDEKFPNLLKSSPLIRIQSNVCDQIELVYKLNQLKLPKIDLCIFSVGIQNEANPLLTREVNFLGIKNAYEATLPYLSSDATLIFISSDRVRKNVTTQIQDLNSYVSSKAEMTSFALDVAKAKKNLKVLIVLPGPVDTALFRSGKSEELISKIDCEVGIFSPDDFANKLIKEVTGNELSRSLILYKNADTQYLTFEQLREQLVI
jgi:NAD(P)-dependent dehydrogenase (short-subunit alcohol dehydrogenase family)